MASKARKTAYCIIFIEKATGRVNRCDIASEFPVTVIRAAEEQAVVTTCDAKDYHTAEHNLRCLLKSRTWLARYMPPALRSSIWG